MPDVRKGKPTNNDSVSSQHSGKANSLYHKVVNLCRDWDKVDEAKAQLIIEYANDALKAFGDTNPEKRVELKEILQKAEHLIPPDSIDSFKRRSEKAFLRGIHLRNKKLRTALFIAFGFGFAIASVLAFIGVPKIIAPYLTKTSNTSKPQAQQEPSVASVSPGQQGGGDTLRGDISTKDEPEVIVDKAMVSLDLTSAWVDLGSDRQLRENKPISRGILRGIFTNVRKLAQNATFTHRLGTTSNFPPTWKHLSPHPVTHTDEAWRKCDPRAKHSFLLSFDISKERVDVPFDLQYEIVFWNAHNGEKDDWQSFFVSRPTKQLIFRVSFPVNKPYKKLNFRHAYGVFCKPTDFKDFPNPRKDETIDPKTGAKVMTWTIDSPQVYWIYGVSWDW